MALTFSHTWRSIEADAAQRRWPPFLLAVLLLGSWVAWASLARVPQYAVTKRARIEVDQTPHRIESPDAPGEVSVLKMALGKKVEAGDVLAKLDTDVLRQQRDAQATRHQGLLREVEALEQQIHAVEGGILQSNEAAARSLPEARALHAEAATAQRTAADNLSRVEKLAAAGQVSQNELVRARSDVEATAAASDAARLRVQRLESEAGAVQKDRESELRRLQGRLERIRGDAHMAKATADQYEHQIEHQTIVAAVDGRIGEMRNNIEVGTYLKPGEWLGTIIPDGGLRIVGYFPPDAALGRIEPGQKSSLRLDAYPAIQYGTIAATVRQVASEPRDGMVRVELELEGAPPKGIPLRHGLPGRLETEVERISPVTLLLRCIGKLDTQEMGQPTPPPAARPRPAATDEATHTPLPPVAPPPLEGDDELGHVHEDGDGGRQE